MVQAEVPGRSKIMMLAKTIERNLFLHSAKSNPGLEGLFFGRRSITSSEGPRCISGKLMPSALTVFNRTIS